MCKLVTSVRTRKGLQEKEKLQENQYAQTPYKLKLKQTYLESRILNLFIQTTETRPFSLNNNFAILYIKFFEPWINTGQHVFFAPAMLLDRGRYH